MTCKYQFFDDGVTMCDKDKTQCPFEVPAEWKCRKCDDECGDKNESKINGGGKDK